MKTLNTPVKEDVMGKFLNRFLFAIIVSALAGIVLGPSSANASLGVCANCHVMHASQVATGGAATTPQDYLLKSTCLGCHTGTNSTNGSAPATPFVYTTGVSDLTTSLAGGNFKFADDNDRNGHNPVELTGGVDATLNANPPGWKSGFNANGQVGGGTPAWASNNLSCAGTYGCHGTHDGSGVNGAHHANSTGALTAATTVANSFRFLYGIKGYEADDYEYSPAATTGDHNVYYGVARSGAEATGDTATDTATISYFCAECHGVFHSGASSNEGISDTSDTFFTDPWIRHPVDISMPTSGEYASYNAYLPGVPVASSDVSDGALTVSGAGDRIVMCLSCHLGHAGPFAADLRWDPSAGVGDAGCKSCHTSK